MKHAIRIQSLSKQYRIRGNTNVLTGLVAPRWQYKHAVKDVSFMVAPGEAVAFLGPNGAGKTTTTKMMTGLIKPTDGHIEVLGYEPFSRNYAFLKKIGLVMGNKAGLNWDLTARQSFELLQKIYGVSDNVFYERVQELTDMLNVAQLLDRQVRKLSLGERMKLELVGSLLHDPSVLFLDEPTIGLDIDSKQSVRNFLRKIHASGKTIILTSHDMDDIDELCERVIVINKGSIMFDGSMQHLADQYASQKFIRLLFAGIVPDVQEIERHGRIVSLKKNSLTMAVDQNNLVKTVTFFSGQYALHDITIESVPLELIVHDLYALQSK